VVVRGSTGLEVRSLYVVYRIQYRTVTYVAKREGLEESSRTLFYALSLVDSHNSTALCAGTSECCMPVTATQCAFLMVSLEAHKSTVD